MRLRKSLAGMTAAELAEVPDDERRHEIEEGRLVSEPLPAPRHDRIRRRLEKILEPAARRGRLGEIFGETGFVLARNPDTVRGPDLSFVRRERLAEIDDSRFFEGAPDLAVEILSPSNRPSEVRAKVADYLSAGSRLVWVLDPHRRAVTAYRSLLAPEVLGEDDLLEADDVLPGLSVRVGEMFGTP